jgi:hypothetical protein
MLRLPLKLMQKYLSRQSQTKLREAKGMEHTRKLAAMLAALVLVLTVLAGLGTLHFDRASADPGSKEDPLATVSYVQKKAQFVRRILPAGESLRLGVGAELLVVDPAFTKLNANGLDPMRDQLVDVTAGKLADAPQIEGQHLYINGSSHDVFLRFERETTILLRGEWK